MQRLKEMKLFDPRFAQYFEADPDIRLGKAKELESKPSKRKKD